MRNISDNCHRNSYGIEFHCVASCGKFHIRRKRDCTEDADLRGPSAPANSSHGWNLQWPEVDVCNFPDVIRFLGLQILIFKAYLFKEIM